MLVQLSSNDPRIRLPELSELELKLSPTLCAFGDGLDPRGAKSFTQGSSSTCAEKKEEREIPQSGVLLRYSSRASPSLRQGPPVI
jgi:hypothetical protein